MLNKSVEDLQKLVLKSQLFYMGLQSKFLLIMHIFMQLPTIKKLKLLFLKIYIGRFDLYLRTNFVRFYSCFNKITITAIFLCFRFDLIIIKLFYDFGLASCNKQETGTLC